MQIILSEGEGRVKGYYSPGGGNLCTQLVSSSTIIF